MNAPAAYEGREPYIFISYAHKNSDRVLPIIAELQSRGFRVWYDAGIEAGTEWPEYIATHLAGCGCFVAFITRDALASQNCRREIHYAISKDLPMLAVYLEQVTLSPGMEMQLGTLQALYSYRHQSVRSFMDALSKATVLRKCLSVAKPGWEDEEELPERPVTRERAEDPGIVPTPPARKVDLSATELDPLFVEAVEVLLHMGAASVSLLQRRMKLGYGRASKLIDQMELCGIVGPFRGAKPRELLIDAAQWEKIKEEWDL